jgi:hypothetical protein
VSGTKIEFRMLSEAEAEAAAAKQPDEPTMCGCKHPDGKPWNVLLDIESGSITTVVCATCELPCVTDNDREFLEGQSIPARLTVTSETYSGPNGTEYDYFLVLDAQPHEVEQ